MLESPVQGAQTHLTTPTKELFIQLLILINLNFLDRAKNQTILSFYSRDTVNFKILQSDWLITFCLVSGTRFFPDIGFVQDNINNINFHYSLNSRITNNQIFQ